MKDIDIRRAAFSAFALCFRPLARMLLRCGVTWKEAAELMKIAYVDVATAEYGKHGRPANASRVAILTGLGRREVKRVRDLGVAAHGSPVAPLAKISHASRVLSAWHQDPDFVDAKGGPRLLDVAGERGFTGLAKRYAPDIPSTAMLKELQAVGAVATTPGGRVRAKMRFYRPAALDADALIRSGDVLRDVGGTVAENLFGEEPRTRFEGRATNVRVPRSARRAFREFVEQRGMALLEDADGWLTKHEAKSSADKTGRLGLGVYLIQDD